MSKGVLQFFAAPSGSDFSVTMFLAHVQCFSVYNWVKMTQLTNKSLLTRQPLTQKAYQPYHNFPSKKVSYQKE